MLKFAFLRTAGELDFIINSDYRWGIELLRSDGDVKEHLDRFRQPGGKYKCFPLSEYRVVHLRMAPWKPQTQDPHYLAVVVAEDCRSAQLLGTSSAGHAESTSVSFEG